MEKLFLFDLIDFDENGNVCASSVNDLFHARSNFLYLLGKYNQILLKNEALPLPAFFKEELPSILNKVMDGGDFETAKKVVLEACLPKVQKCLALSDKKTILNLNELVVAADKTYAKKFQNVVNNLQLTYIITGVSGKVLDEILELQTQQESKENRSQLFKQVIKYNSLVSTASKVKDNKISFETVKNLAG